MPQAGGVAIFWNLDQCPLPDDRAASTVTKGIRRICQTYGKGIKGFTAYSSEALKTTSSSLLQCGVTVKYSPPHNIHKPLIVIQMTVDILMMITRENTIGTFVLIAGDRDYSYMLESIRDQGVRIVVMAPKGTACSSSCLLWPEAAITAGSLPELTGNNSPPGVISLPISAKSQSRHPKLEVLEPAAGAMEQDVESGDHPQDASMEVGSDPEVEAAPFKRTEVRPVKSTQVANKDGTSSVADGSDLESMEPLIVNALGSQSSRFTERDNSVETVEDDLLSSDVEAQVKDETAVEYHCRTTSTSRSLGDDNEGSSEDEESESEQEDSGDEDEDEEGEEESSDDEDGTEDESAVESDNDDESLDASAEEDNGGVKYHRRPTSTSLGHDSGAEGDGQGSSGDDGDGSEQEDSDNDDEDEEESEEESSDDEDGTEDESAVESCNRESSDASEEEVSDNESEEEDADDSEDKSEPDVTVTAISRKRKRKPQNRSPDCAQPNSSTNGKPLGSGGEVNGAAARRSKKAKIES